MDFEYSEMFESWLKTEIDKLEREGIVFVLEPVIGSVGVSWSGDPWVYDQTGIRYVLSFNDGIADYIYDLKDKRYCRLPMYASACVLIKYGDLLINEKGWKYISRIAVIETLKKKQVEIAGEIKRLSKSRSKWAGSLAQSYTRDLVRIEKALAYLSY